MSAGQGHLTAGSPTAAGLARLARQLQQLDGSIAGGLLAYVERARGLLRDARDGKNPLEGYVPSIPSGHALELGSAAFGEYEAAGVAAMRGAAFVLVAGGLGERLGFSGIKLSSPPRCSRSAPTSSSTPPTSRLCSTNAASRCRSC